MNAVAFQLTSLLFAVAMLAFSFWRWVIPAMKAKRQEKYRFGLTDLRHRLFYLALTNGIQADGEFFRIFYPLITTCANADEYKVELRVLFGSDLSEENKREIDQHLAYWKNVLAKSSVAEVKIAREYFDLMRKILLDNSLRLRILVRCARLFYAIRKYRDGVVACLSKVPGWGEEVEVYTGLGKLAGCK